MIKTYIHNIKDIRKRDDEVNNFIQEHGSWSTQTNTVNDQIITTIYYGIRTELKSL